MTYRTLLEEAITTSDDPQITRDAIIELKRREDAATTFVSLGWAALAGVVLVVTAQCILVHSDGAGSTTMPTTGNGLTGLGIAAAGALWCLAWYVSGSLAGFLFGIPRSQAVPNPVAAAATNGTQSPRTVPGLGVNTNLEQISDWLTKIIVGLGLIELRNLPGRLSRLAQYMTDSHCAIACAPLALSIILAFSILGFLMGYLATRMFLAPAFASADQAATDNRDSMQSLRDAHVSPPGAGGVTETKTTSASPDAINLAKQISRSSQDPSSSRSASTYDVAKAHLLAHEYQAAVRAYERVMQLNPDDPKVRYEYAVALSYISSEYAPKVREQLLKAYDRIQQLDVLTQGDLYTWLTYAFLYQESEQGYETSIRFGEEALSKGIRNGSVFVNLACAYAQKYTHVQDTEERNRLRKLVISMIENASKFGEEYVARLRELLEPTDASSPDDDLSVFRTDDEVRRAMGLPATGSGSP